MGSNNTDATLYQLRTVTKACLAAKVTGGSCSCHSCHSRGILPTKFEHTIFSPSTLKTLRESLHPATMRTGHITDARGGLAPYYHIAGRARETTRRGYEHTQDTVPDNFPSPPVHFPFLSLPSPTVAASSSLL